MSQPRRRSASPARKIGLALAVLALLATGGYLWSKRGASTESAYRTETVQRGDIRVAISATGTLSAITTVTVGSQISGQVTDVRVDFNSPVRKGDVLAVIDPSSFQAQIEQGAAQVASARAQLRQAQAALRNAQLDYRRKADLDRQQLIARSDLDLARAALEQAQAQVNAAHAQIRSQAAATQTTRVNLQRTVIRSPVDGVVLTRKIEPGQTVAASLQAPELFTIAEDLSKMKIELAVDESDIGQVKVGQNVSFNADAFPDRQFRGVVDQVRLSATTTSNVVTYPVVVRVDNSDGTLLPGLTVNAEIEVSNKPGVLKVGNAALRFKPDENSELAKLAAASAPGGGQGGQGGPGGGRSAGMLDDLARAAADLGLNPAQQAAFDDALAQMRERTMARQAQPQAQGQGGSPLFGRGGGPGGPRMVVMGAGGDASLQAQMRQRMRERFNQQFGGFRGSLDEAQRARWDAAVAGLLGARRSQLYTLVDGKPRVVSVRLGASDGSSTEVAGDIREGDTVIVGERAQAP